MTGFNRKEVAKLLVECHRRCCVCHRFCGTKIETDHIDQAADSNDHSIENAIPVCFDCHAEIHAYNPRHPKGRRFTKDELKGHKANWLEICKNRPEILIHASREVDSGPIQGMLDELEHNLTMAKDLSGYTLGFVFRDEQLSRAIREGTMSILDSDLKSEISIAYAAISRSNETVRSLPHKSDEVRYNVLRQIEADLPKIQSAATTLRNFLYSPETSDTVASDDS